MHLRLHALIQRPCFSQALIATLRDENSSTFYSLNFGRFTSGFSESASVSLTNIRKPLGFTGPESQDYANIPRSISSTGQPLPSRSSQDTAQSYRRTRRTVWRFVCLSGMEYGISRLPPGGHSGIWNLPNWTSAQDRTPGIPKSSHSDRQSLVAYPSFVDQPMAVASAD